VHSPKPPRSDCKKASIWCRYYDAMALADDAGAFDLSFLHFKTSGFPSIEAAKQAAPEFARRVLARSLELNDFGLIGKLRGR